MILLDTHVWIWWIQNDPHASEIVPILDALPPSEIAISSISCWEVAALHARRRLLFNCTLDEWLSAALHDSGVTTINLTPAMAIESERLPGDIHKDPADRMLIATARLLGCKLLTADQKILNYPHVQAVALKDIKNQNPSSESGNS